MTKIMLLCSAGMSTSMLVQRMETAATEASIEAQIWACGEGEARTRIDECDVILLGPQVRFLKGEFEKLIAGKSIKLDVINSTDYGTMNGKAVLDHAFKLISE